MSATIDDSERVIVVGSGPAGAIAARELVRAGVPVTMLESGLRPPSGIIVRAAGQTLLRRRDGSDLLSRRHVAIGDRDTEWWSSLSPGGLSNYWTAAVPRFAPADFDDGARIDDRFRWPVSYDDLTPFYDVAEDLLSITGPATSIPLVPGGRARYRRDVPSDWKRAFAGQHTDELTVLALARGAKWMIARRGSEFNSYHVIVAPLLSNASFELRVGAHVRRLATADDGSVIGVECTDRTSGQASVVRGRAVVLAAGTVDTTRILLSSTSSAWPDGVGNQHGLVGRYLHDHTREWWPVELDRPLTLLDHPLYLAREAHEDTEPLSGASATIGLATPRDRLQTFIGRAGKRFGVQVFGTMVPDEDHRVTLSPTRVDEFGNPVVQLDVAYDERTLRVLTRMKERFVEVFADVGIGATIEPVEWTPRPGSSVHFAGSVRMHDRPESGVVDRWNRVHGVENVLVTDMSSFTTNPEKNPTLTAMALSARAARHLAADRSIAAR
ncbi:unnamed protein product [Phaeothamnion confervicola]